MQSTKDTFYMTLRDRLATLNPARVIGVGATTRPAVVVAENELIVPVRPQPDTFYLEWGTAQPAPQQAGRRAIFSLECLISYHTYGTVESGVDRGRALAALDTELLSIATPGNAAKFDYTANPPASLGTNIVWATPQLGKVVGSEEQRNGGMPRGDSSIRLERTANLKIYFFPETQTQQ